jgi:hypothetical protein
MIIIARYGSSKPGAASRLWPDIQTCSSREHIVAQEIVSSQRPTTTQYGNGRRVKYGVWGHRRRDRNAREIEPNICFESKLLH